MLSTPIHFCKIDICNIHIFILQKIYIELRPYMVLFGSFCILLVHFPPLAALGGSKVSYILYSVFYWLRSIFHTVFFLL